MKKGKQGVHSLLSIAAKRRQIADEALARGECMVPECKERAVEVVEFTSTPPHSLCQFHLDLIVKGCRS